MELSLQAKTFLVVMATGALLGMTFDFYRVLRGVFKPHWFVTGLADLSFWVAATAAVAGALLMTNWGELRFYVFIGLSVGTLLYYRLLSRHTMHILIGLIRVIATIIGYVRLIIFHAILKPLVMIGKILWLPVNFVSRRLAELTKKPPDDENIPPKD